MARGFGGRNGCEALRRRGKSARLPCSGAIDLHESVNPLLPGVTALPVNGVRTDIAACVTRNKKVEVEPPLFRERPICGGPANERTPFLLVKNLRMQTTHPLTGNWRRELFTQSQNHTLTSQQVV